MNVERNLAWPIRYCPLHVHKTPHQRHDWLKLHDRRLFRAWCPGFGLQHAEVSNRSLDDARDEAYASGRYAQTSKGIVMKFKVFGRSPTLAVQAIGAIAMVVAVFGWDALTVEQAGLLTAALAALVAAVNALLVRPVNPALFAGFIQAGAALVVSYGLTVTQEQLGAIQFGVQSIVAFVLLNYVTPAADPAVGGGVSAKDVPGAPVSPAGEPVTDVR